EYAARRMRRAGEWPENPASVRRPPKGPGRPRNRKPSTPVSVRFAPDVVEALRDVAEAAGYERERVGVVLSEAARRAATRATKRKPKGAPFGLEPGEAVALEGGRRSVTLSVCVDADAFDRLCKAMPDTAPMTALYDAAVRLLQDL